MSHLSPIHDLQLRELVKVCVQTLEEARPDASQVLDVAETQFELTSGGGR